MLKNKEKCGSTFIFFYYYYYYYYYYSIRVYGGMVVYLHSFLSFIPDGGEWPSSTPASFPLGTDPQYLLGKSLGRLQS
jgi:hypothetical protein